MINRLSNLINRNRSAVKILQVLCSNLGSLEGNEWGPSHQHLRVRVTIWKFGLISLIEDGDEIIIDAVKNEINVNVSQEKLDLRKKSWIKPDLKFKSGILYKYSKLVSSASKGCVTD